MIFNRREKRLLYKLGFLEVQKDPFFEYSTGLAFSARNDDYWDKRISIEIRKKHCHFCKIVHDANRDGFDTNDIPLLFYHNVGMFTFKVYEKKEAINDNYERILIYSKHIKTFDYKTPLFQFLYDYYNEKKLKNRHGFYWRRDDKVGQEVL